MITFILSIGNKSKKGLYTVIDEYDLEIIDDGQNTETVNAVLAEYNNDEVNDVNYAELKMYIKGSRSENGYLICKYARDVKTNIWLI